MSDARQNSKREAQNWLDRRDLWEDHGVQGKLLVVLGALHLDQSTCPPNFSLLPHLWHPAQRMSHIFGFAALM